MSKARGIGAAKKTTWHARTVIKPANFIAFAGLFAVAGIIWLASGSAATFAASGEAENGQKSGNVGSGDTAGASGGAALKFGANSGSGSILFEDDFNGSAGSKPDQNKWGEFCPGSIMTGSFGQIRCGADETLDGFGRLILPATPQYGTGLVTKNSHRFTYGTFSAWIKVPQEVGYWPAFWLINPPNSNGSGGGGEIDILELYTTWPTIYHDTVHSWGPNGVHLWASPDDFNETGMNIYSGYHKFSAKVEPGKISFFFDDRPYGTVVTKATVNNQAWPFGPDTTLPHFLILNLALGGAGGQQQPATQPAKMLVDRVEVRSL